MSISTRDENERLHSEAVRQHRQEFGRESRVAVVAARAQLVNGKACFPRRVVVNASEVRVDYRYVQWVLFPNDEWRYHTAVEGRQFLTARARYEGQIVESVYRDGVARRAVVI